MVTLYYVDRVDSFVAFAPSLRLLPHLVSIDPRAFLVNGPTVVVLVSHPWSFVELCDNLTKTGLLSFRLFLVLAFSSLT